MFAKPYKLKSSNTLKNSEKKYLIQRILDEYPTSTEEKVKEIVPLKSVTSCMKLVLYSDETINVYAVDGVPMILELSEGLVPTVCALWRVPDLVPTVTISSQVLSKVCGGAPLFAPGVSGSSGAVWGPRAVLAARTTTNRAAALVGRAAMSSADLLYRASGACLDCIHFYRDQLCKDVKFNKIEIPELGPVGPEDEALLTGVQQLSIQQPIKEEWPSLGKPPPPAPAPTPTPTPAHNEPKLIAETPTEAHHTDDTEHRMDTTLNDSVDDDLYVPTDMDGLLRWCLLSFIKLQGKSVELPLKTNLLYRNYLIPLCPRERTLDVKKSSYKKMGKFLDAMQKEGLISVREVERGVDALVEVAATHAAVRAHTAPREGGPAPPAPPAAPDYEPPHLRELYCVTAAVAALLAPARKGAALTAAEVRGAVTQYVRARQLPGERGALQADATLAKLTGKREQDYITWEELMSVVLDKMTPSTEMRFADGAVKLIKSRLEPIKMQTVNRSGNKKVTLVSNLESYGFALAPLAGSWQRAAAAACIVTRCAGARADQLLLQGDQTHFVAKILIEKYGLPKKFLEGADKALNKKK